MSLFVQYLKWSVQKFPPPLRQLLGRGWDYFMRLIRWLFILKEIRGITFRDELVLLISAFVSPITSMRQFGKWQDPVLLCDTSVRVQGIGIFFLRQKTDDLWHVLPSREISVLDSISQHLKPGNIFVDAGTNIGFFSIYAGRLVGVSGRVISIEMMPETAEILRKHVSSNCLENITVIEQALTDSVGKKVLARVTAGQYGQASIADGVSNDGREVQVTTTTLADILAGVKRVDLMKMDLEGAEALALNGAGEAMCKVKMVVFEDWGDNTRLSEIFKRKNFSVERLDGSNSIAKNLAPM